MSVTIQVTFTDLPLNAYNGEYTKASSEYNFVNGDYQITPTIDQTRYALLNGAMTIDYIYAHRGDYYIYNSTGNQIGYYSGGNVNTLNCFTDTCDILTSSGYKNIKDLNIGDLVLTQDNREVPILDKVEFTSVEKPILIKKDQYGINVPSKDTHISNEHAYKIDNKWKINCFDHELEKNWNEIIVKYYHIKLPNYYTDKLMINGIEMESWYGKNYGKPRTTSWKKIDNEMVLIYNKSHEKVNF